MSDHLDWDSPIESKEIKTKLIEPGHYPFKVINLEKTISTGPKTSGAKMAIITVRIEHDEGEYIDIKDKIVLLKSLDWKIFQFFISTGQCQKDENNKWKTIDKPPWDASIGRRGHCEVIIEDYKKKDGTDGKAVKIAKYVDPAENKPTDGAEPWEE
jgi:hypothetical protein